VTEIYNYKPVIIESPFKVNDYYSEFTHRAYLERCLRDAVLRGETPYASHKMLPDAFDDASVKERETGMRAGLSMSRDMAVKMGATPVFCVDYGQGGTGMKRAREFYQDHYVDIVERRIGMNPKGFTCIHGAHAALQHEYGVLQRKYEELRFRMDGLEK